MDKRSQAVHLQEDVALETFSGEIPIEPSSTYNNRERSHSTAKFEIQHDDSDVATFEQTNQSQSDRSVAYSRWTIAQKIICMMLTAMQTVLLAFSLFLLIVSHIEKLVVWNFVQELVNGVFYLGGTIFGWMSLYSTWSTVYRKKQSLYALIGLIGIVIVGICEMLLIFFPFIPGVDTAPNVTFDIFSKWYQQTDFQQVIIMPVVITGLLFGGAIISGVGRVVIMRRDDKRGTVRL
jgi:uncharacterized membrane protein